MKSLKKISFILSLVGIFCLNSASFSWAQELPESKPTDIMVQSYSTFVGPGNLGGKELGGQNLSNKLSSALKSFEEGKEFNLIPCGNTFCDPEHTKCITCRYYETVLRSASYTESFCINKNESAEQYSRTFAPIEEGGEIGNLLEDLGNTALWLVSFGSVSRSNITSISCEETPNGAIGSESSGLYGLMKDTYGMQLLGNDGNYYSISLIGDNVEITYANPDSKDTTNLFRGCEVLPVKLYNHRNCFFCPLFAVVYRAAVNITSISFKKLSIAFATIITVGLAVWIAFQALTHVSSLTKQDAPKFLSGIIKQSYKFVIAFFLLQYSQQIFSYAINPILESGMTIGKNLLTNQVDYSQIDKDSDEWEKQEKRVAGIPEGYYGKDLYQKLDSFVTSLQREIAFMQVVGSSLVCTGGNLMIDGEWKEFGDGFQMFVQGAVIAVFGFLLSIAFAFYLMDAVVQLGVVGALMPFLIACWPFKITSKYTSTGFNMILNSFFVFAFIGLVISVNMNLIDSALEMTDAPGAEETLIKLCMKGPGATRESCEAIISGTGALAKIYITINNQDDETLRKLTDISGIGFLILIFCCIFGFKFVGQTGSLAGQFASAPGKPIAPSIATMGASAALGVAKKTTQPIRKAVSDKAEDVGMNIIRGIPSAPAKLYNGTKNVANKVGNFFKGKNGVSNNGSATTEKTGGSNTNNSGGKQTTQSSQTSASVGQKNNASGQANNGTPKVQQGKPREENAKDNLEKTLNADENSQNSDELATNNNSMNQPVQTRSQKAKNSSKNSRKRKRDKRKRAHRK